MVEPCREARSSSVTCKPLFYLVTRSVLLSKSYVPVSDPNQSLRCVNLDLLGMCDCLSNFCASVVLSLSLTALSRLTWPDRIALYNIGDIFLPFLSLDVSRRVSI